MKYLLLLAVCAIFSESLAGVAPVCSESKCKIENNCRCSSNTNPLSQGKAPQLIGLTIDESVVKDGYDAYWDPLLYSRVNPDKVPIGATFFVPHLDTDYERVNDLYMSGFEIGVHSITKNSKQSYWRSADLKTLTQEFEGQREILATFANIPIDDIQGVRSPQLQYHGNTSIQAYIAANLTYDSSWPTLPSHPLFPYTLDYLSSEQCNACPECPNESYPGFWVVPINDLNGADKECNTLVTCGINGTAKEIRDWLLGEINKVRSGSRVPMTLTVNSYWFNFTDNSFEALNMVMDEVGKMDDTFFVSQKQIVDWVKKPVPLSEFKTEFPDRNADCFPIRCVLKNEKGETTYMQSCVDCPEVYPWLGNPSGKKQ